MTSKWAATGLGLLLVCAACSSSGNSRSAAKTSTTLGHNSTGAAIVFREVIGQVPYGRVAPSAPTSAGATTAAATSCDGGRLATPAAGQKPDDTIILPDSTHSSCYELGPVLLTETRVGSAQAVASQTTNDWEIDLHFDDNDFVTRVAGPYVNRQIAIIVDGVVESAPTIEAGITGQDVTISSTFDEAQAVQLATLIDPNASQHPATPTTTATDKQLDAFQRRCAAVAPRLDANASFTGATSMLPVAILRLAFTKAHQPFPAALANSNDDKAMAVCDFTPTPTSPPPISPTTVCPNGDTVDVGPTIPVVAYAVDADLNAIRLPDMQDVVPPGLSEQLPGPCSGLPSP